MLVVLGFLVWLSACGLDGGGGVSAPGYALPYTLTSPTRSFTLHPKVQEISGISCSRDEKHLLAVQDEQGEVFLLQRGNGGLRDSVSFWKDGDYEGLVQAEDQVFVLKSTGTLYGISHFGTPDQAVAKYNYFLNSDYDAEGLGYDARTGRLLIACKGPGDGPEADAFRRPVFAFDLKRKTLDSIPVHLITRQAIYEFLTANDTLPLWSKMIDDFQPDSPEMEFNPSALAVHPQTGHRYILSSAGKKMLMVIDTAGRILHLTKLPKKQHRQPEGLCFDSQGRMYIANEGKGVDPPRLHVYETLP